MQQKFCRSEGVTQYIQSDERKKSTTKTILYPARLSFTFDAEIKRFTNKQKLREFSTTKPVSNQNLKKLLFGSGGRVKPQLDRRKSQMGKFTGEGKHNSRSMKLSRYKYDTKTSNSEESTNTRNTNCV